MATWNSLSLLGMALAASSLAACRSYDSGPALLAPDLECALDGGEGAPCSCPGSSVCPPGESLSWKCSDNGVWEKTDLSCVLGLSCRSSADCSGGQACCGDPYSGSWGTQITSSSCWAAPCPADLVQLCQDAGECVAPGSACGAAAQAYGGGTVSTCTAGAGSH